MTTEQYKLFLEIISIQKVKFGVSNEDLRKFDVEILPLFMDCLGTKRFLNVFTISENPSMKITKRIAERITLSDSLWYRHNDFWLSKADSFTLNYLMKSFCEYNNIEWDNCYSSDNIMIYLENIHKDREIQKQFTFDLRKYTQDFIIYIQNRLKNQYEQTN